MSRRKIRLFKESKTFSAAIALLEISNISYGKNPDGCRQLSP